MKKRKKTMIEILIECDECLASCSIHHELDEDQYELTEECPFCGSDNVLLEYGEEIR
jgi:Zn finger protein HypA/HybF involved in hydrogenase expression